MVALPDQCIDRTVGSLLLLAPGVTRISLGCSRVGGGVGAK